MIDFHTHIFPDRIAAKTLGFLQSNCNINPYTEATSKSLIKSMEESGVSAAVILPVVTNPAQFDSVNEFASHFTEGSLISFGGIHPDCQNCKGKLKQIKSYGLKGIKLHPDYQNAYFNDIRYKRIISDASDLDLIISVHAGVDVGYPDEVHCTPKMIKEVIAQTAPPKLVLAHMGGFGMWNQVEELLAGQDVYLDTAFVFGHLDEEQFIRIVRKHGKEKVLFATDSPWASQTESADYFNRTGLTEEEKELIGHKNAERLLWGK